MDSNKPLGRGILKAALITIAVSSGSVLLFNGCSNIDGPSANIGIAVSPSTAFIVPGTGSSCIAATDAKREGTDIVARDLQADRAFFQNFSLQWRSPDALTISELVLELTGSALAAPDGQTISFNEDEIRALTGLADLTITQEDTRSENAPFTLNSNDSRIKGVNYAPCGFHVAGIQTDPEKNSGSVSIKITIRGYQTDKLGNQKPVRQTTTIRAEKL